jgi:uncharacterized protein (TIGR00255 family)
MLRSMTGFGTGRAKVEEEELAVELKSLNHKFCEVKVRLPRELSALEAAAGKLVKDRLHRGAVELLIKRQAQAASDTVPQVDLALAREYRRALSEIARAVGVADEATLADIAFQPGVIRLEERGVNLEHAQKALEAAVGQALDGLSEMRRKEGEAIRADLDARLSAIEAVSREVAALAPRSVDDYRQRLQDRLAELGRGLPLDPQRLAQEVAYFAERTDVAEEMTRLASHLQQFRALLASQEPAGRKMDFLVQEMHREVNTTGSKSQHPEISTRIVAMKAELERVREQVQNVE